MPKFHAFSTKLLDAVLPAVTSAPGAWTPAVGEIPCGNGATQGSFKAPLVVGLSDTVCDRATIQKVGGVAQEQSLVGSTYSTSGSGPWTATLTSALTWSNLPSFTWNDVYVADSAATQQGLVYVGTAIGKIINSGDSVLVSSGNLSETSS